MTRISMLFALAIVLLAGLLPVCSQTIILNGQKVALTFVDQNGKPIADILALVKLLGGTATYDKATKKVYITLPPAGGAATAGATGTSQLAGDWAKLNTVYTIGKDNSYHITLKSVEYTLARISIGDTTYTPNKDQKLLVMHYTVQNPRKEEANLHWNTLKFTAIDDKNVNYESIRDIGDLSTRAPLNMNLKPAQKVEVYTAFLVPAKAVIPKIMIQSVSDETAPVLRYEPTKDLKPFSAPFVSTDDATGFTPQVEVSAKMGSYYPFGLYDVNVEKVEFSTKAINDEELGEGDRFFIITVKCKNMSPIEQNLHWNTFHPALRTTDGDEINWSGNLLLGSADRTADLNVKPNNEVTVRYYYIVGQDIKLHSFSLNEVEEGRVYSYDMSTMK